MQNSKTKEVYNDWHAVDVSSVLPSHVCLSFSHMSYRKHLWLAHASESKMTTQHLNAHPAAQYRRCRQHMGSGVLTDLQACCLLSVILARHTLGLLESIHFWLGSLEHYLEMSVMVHYMHVTWIGSQNTTNPAALVAPAPVCTAAQLVTSFEVKKWASEIHFPYITS